MIFPFGGICIRFLEGYFLENPPFSIGNRSGVYTLSRPEVENGCISNMIISFHLGWCSNFHLFPLFPPSHSTTSTFSQVVFFLRNFRKKFIYHTNLQPDMVEFVSTLPKTDPPPWLPPKQICYSAADSAESPRYSHHSWPLVGKTVSFVSPLKRLVPKVGLKG